MGKTYRVEGTFRMGTQWVHFANEVPADTTEKARERTLSEIGSRHHVGRRYIKIEQVAEAKPGAEGHGR